MSLKANQLWVVQTSEELSAAVRRMVWKWAGVDRRTIGEQLLRSSDSIGANIVEGYGRLHPLDSRRFYSIALGSLEETIFWIKRSETSGLVSTNESRHLRQRYALLSHSLTKFARIKRPESH